MPYISFGKLPNILGNFGQPIQSQLDGLREVDRATKVDGTSLSDDTASAVSSWEDWGTETITFTNPGMPVTVTAQLAGAASHLPSSRRLAEVRVSVSFDGGSSFTNGPGPRSELDSTDMDSTFVGAAFSVSGTPTGDIVIKAQLHHPILGTAGDVGFSAGYLTAQMAPS